MPYVNDSHRTQHHDDGLIASDSNQRSHEPLATIVFNTSTRPGVPLNSSTISTGAIGGKHGGNMHSTLSEAHVATGGASRQKPADPAL